MSGCQLPLEWETLCVHASVSGRAHAPSFLIEHVHPEEARALDTLFFICHTKAHRTDLQAKHPLHFRRLLLFGLSKPLLLSTGTK